MFYSMPKRVTRYSLRGLCMFQSSELLAEAPSPLYQSQWAQTSDKHRLLKQHLMLLCSHLSIRGGWMMLDALKIKHRNCIDSVAFSFCSAVRFRLWRDITKACEFEEFQQ